MAPNSKEETKAYLLCLDGSIANDPNLHFNHLFPNWTALMDTSPSATWNVCGVQNSVLHLGAIAS